MKLYKYDVRTLEQHEVIESEKTPVVLKKAKENKSYKGFIYSQEDKKGDKLDVLTTFFNTSVVCPQLNVVFTQQSKVEIDNEKISNAHYVAKGVREHTKGFTFKYVKDYIKENPDALLYLAEEGISVKTKKEGVLKTPITDNLILLNGDGDTEDMVENISTDFKISKEKATSAIASLVSILEGDSVEPTVESTESKNLETLKEQKKEVKSSSVLKAVDSLESKLQHLKATQERGTREKETKEEVVKKAVEKEVVEKEGEIEVGVLETSLSSEIELLNSLTTLVLILSESGEGVLDVFSPLVQKFIFQVRCRLVRYWNEKIEKGIFTDTDYKLYQKLNKILFKK